jgi:hypothetical protein
MEWIDIAKWIGGSLLAFVAAGGEIHVTRKSVRVVLPKWKRPE